MNNMDVIPMLSLSCQSVTAKAWQALDLGKISRLKCKAYLLKDIELMAN